MNSEQGLRYQRQIMLPHFGISNQQKLLQARALIIGVGGLGSPVAMYLAAAGVGTLVLVDFDHVDISNLQRQIIHRHTTIGTPKVISAKHTLLGINPDCNVITKDYRLTPEELETELKQANVALDCSDNFSTRFALNRACVQVGIPLVAGAVGQWDGQVMTVLPGLGPCYQCLYPNINDPSTDCSRAGLLAPTPGVIGSLQALQAIQVLTNYGESLAGKLLLFNALNMSWRTLTVPRDPACVICSN
ncbi:hypothetical protein TI04_07695 [Achromatium sp. WMS2]|nr:hypothetical protein TI04_07695 [Achromatium sp. WMS2]